MNLILSTAHTQTVRKALANQLQRAKQKQDAEEIQRIREILNLIDLKESLK